MKNFSRFDAFIYILIIANILAMILESHSFMKDRFGQIFSFFELISILIFTAEYLYRIYMSYKEKKLKGVFSYVFSFFGIIDFIFNNGSNDVLVVKHNNEFSYLALIKDNITLIPNKKIIIKHESV